MDDDDDDLFLKNSQISVHEIGTQDEDEYGRGEFAALTAAVNAAAGPAPGTVRPIALPSPDQSPGGENNGQEPVHENGNGTAEISQEASQETPREARPEVAQEISLEARQEASQEVSHGAPHEAPHEACPEVSQVVAHEAPEAPHEARQEVHQEASQEAPQEAPQAEGQQTQAQTQTQEQVQQNSPPVDASMAAAQPARAVQTPAELKIDQTFWENGLAVATSVLEHPPASEFDIPLVSLLHTACLRQDLFFLTLYQMYCFSKHQPAAFATIADFKGKPTQGLRVIDRLLLLKKDLSPSFLHWSIRFPVRPRIMMTNPEYQATIKHVGFFLGLANDRWVDYESHVQARGYPPLVDELAMLFSIRSPTVIFVMFVNLSCHMYRSDNEQRFHELFNQNKMAFERRMQANEAAPPDQMERETKPLILAYLALNPSFNLTPATRIVTPWFSGSVNPALLRYLSSASFLQSTGPVKITQPTQARPPQAMGQGQTTGQSQSQGQAQATAQSQAAGPVQVNTPTQARPLQALSLVQARGPVQLVGPHVQANSSVHSSPQSYVSPYPWTQNPPPHQQTLVVNGTGGMVATTPANGSHYFRPFESSGLQDRPTGQVSQPQLPQMPVPPIQRPVQQFQQQVQRPVQHVQQPIQQPVQHVQHPTQRSVQQPVQQVQHVQHPIQRPVQQPTQQVQQVQDQGRGRGRALSLGTNLLPAPGVLPVTTVRPNPLRIALHQAHLRDPQFRLFHLKEDQSGLEESSLVQHFSTFKVGPVPLGLVECAFSFNFLMDNDEFQKRTALAQNAQGQRVTRLVASGDQILRFRCIKTTPNNTTLDQYTWNSTDTSWPSVIYVFVNDTELFVRRKFHNGKDLPLDITDYLCHGINKVTFHVLRSPAESKNVHYAAAVEVMDMNTESQARRFCKVHLADRSRGRLQRRLQQSRDKDDDVSIVTEDITIDLIDPFTARIWDLPARSSQCVHPECFDHRTFIHTRLNPPSFVGPLKDNWKCPICSADASPRNLVIDAFLVEVREVLVKSGRLDTAKALKFRADGSYEVKFDGSDAASAGGAGATSATPTIPSKRKHGEIESPEQSKSAVQARASQTPGSSNVIELD